MDRLESSKRGVYLTGARSDEAMVVSLWANERGFNCAWLSQEDAVEREVDLHATLVVADARENPHDAIAQMARIRAAHWEVPLLLLRPREQHEPSFLRAAARSGADSDPRGTSRTEYLARRPRAIGGAEHTGRAQAKADQAQ
ncbi:MAG: hypothetical protein QM784_08955 [Polyangiaceae bacterium]